MRHFFYKIPFFISLFIVFGLSAQNKKDTINHGMMQKELERVKALRYQDSIRLALLSEEIFQLKFNQQTQIDNNSVKKDSLLLLQKAEIDAIRSTTKGAPVVFFNDTLFRIYSSMGPYTAQMRAKNLEEKLDMLYQKPFFFPDSLTTKASNGFYNISYQNEIITGITINDALWADTTPEELLENHTKIIKNTISNYRQQHSLKNNLFRLLELVVIILVASGIVWFINFIFSRIKNSIVNRNLKFINGIKIRGYELLKKEHIVSFILRAVSVVKVILLFVLFLTIIPLVFSIFPSTQNWSEVIRQWVWEPVKSMWISLLNYFPSLIRIVIILIVVRYILRILRYLSLEIERGVLTIKGFYPEWARTTYALARFMLLMLALVIIFPYLPGSDSTAFKGISVFLGILISIGSSSAVANAVAGLVITYMRPFRPGDWIKTGNITGIVIEKNALVTRLKTINNEDVSVPNSAILSGPTINYTSIGKKEGLAITAVVRVRYDYPQNVIEELLLEAAHKTHGIVEKPYPYVFQLALAEINAVYELNAFTFAPENMYFIKSDLMKNIQNVFKEAGVDIYSTQYIEIKKTEN